MIFYAVANGRKTGIFLNWIDCNNSVKGYPNAKYKKFNTIEQAETFIKLNIINLFEQLIIPDYYIYTDGSCINNGKSNALAGIGIFFGINDIRNISQKIEGKQTNNTAELIAIIKVYSIIKNDIISGKKITIVSDSKYAIHCVSTFRKDWNINIPNKELVKIAYNMYKDNPNIQFIYIKAHTNNNDIHSFGNQNADKLAKMALNL